MVDITAVKIFDFDTIEKLDFAHPALDTAAEVCQWRAVALPTMPHRLHDAELRQRPRVVFRGTGAAHQFATLAAMMASLLSLKAYQ